ncbi:hypothetical protein [Pasteurella sp. PK-2025]|uniref:hypothetical protein n=1 Tax=Pasteurella sp. PK-2025 TaxID=3413133 RepID=UPI003C73DF63
MKKIYSLTGEYTENSSFIEIYPDNQESIIGRAMEQHWRPFENYKPIILRLYPSDNGKKNYKFDFSGSLIPFCVFSENAVATLQDILLPSGQLLDITTDSKRKKYFGYYPITKYPKGILDLEKSIYKEYPKGLLIRKPVLKRDKIPEDALFCIEEDFSRIYVTDTFKNLVEISGLVGFSFDKNSEIELS